MSANDAGTAMIRAGLRALRGLALAAGVVSTAAASPDVADSTEAAAKRDATRWKSLSWNAGLRARCGTFAITELTALLKAGGTQLSSIHWTLLAEPFLPLTAPAHVKRVVP